VRRHASLDSDQAPRHVGEPGLRSGRGQAFPQNDRPLLVETDQMQGVLARIDARGVRRVAAVLWDIAITPRASKPPGHPLSGSGRDTARLH